MKRLSLIGVVQWWLVAILVGVVVHAPLSVFLGSLWPDIALEVKAWKEITLLILSIITAIDLSRKRLWSWVLRDRILQLAMVFILLHLLLVPLFYTGLLPTIAGLMIDLRFIVFFMLCYITAQHSPLLRRYALWGVAAGAIVVVGFGLLQLTVLPEDALTTIGYSTETIRPFTTIDRNPDYIRIQSTTRGPNPLGAMMVIYAAVGVAVLLSRRSWLASRRKVLLVAAAAAASFAVLVGSFSRSAYLGCGVALTLVLASTMQLTKKVIGGVMLLALIAVAVLVPLQSSDWFSNVVLHEDPESTVMKKSNDEHIRSLEVGSQRVLGEPFGAGIGSTGSASLYDDTPGPIIENQYLFIAHEAGWLGLLIFIGLFAVILWQLWRKRTDWLALGMFASGIGLAGIGLLLPVWVDETVALSWWGLVGVALSATKR